MQIREVFDRKRFVFLDGGMGTQLQARGLQPGQKPELAALEMPEVLTAIHTDYANAGADILLANTFGANAKKLTGCGHTVEEVVSASISCARKAAETTGACVALDIGPLGELLVPAGTLAFEDAYNEFAQVIRAGAAAGADLVFLETMTDLYELKAAILAARENCDLPVFTSMSFESRGRTFTGCTVESYAVTAAGLGADAVGINCSLGPKEILPFAQRLCRSVPAGVPVFVKPNAGLPNPDGSYNLDPDEFAAEMKEYAAIGVSMVGGCCGTTPAFIARLHETFSPLTPADKIPIRRSCLCTPVRFVEVDGITVVGERINPTGKKRLQQALRDGPWRVIDRESMQTDAEREQAAHDCLSADFFLTGANAVSLTGELVNIDGKGNRVAAIVFGPREIIVIAGMNKVVDTLDEAVRRARTIAAPKNEQRFLGKTPCAQTGCCANCHGEECICNQILITRNCRPAGRIHVILVGEELGF